MEVLLILVVVVGVAVGVGITTWQFSRQGAGRHVWVVDATTDLSGLENSLNHFSDEGFGIHRILSSQLGTEHPMFVIVACRSEHTLPEPSWI